MLLLHREAACERTELSRSHVLPLASLVAASSHYLRSFVDAPPWSTPLSVHDLSALARLSALRDLNLDNHRLSSGATSALAGLTQLRCLSMGSYGLSASALTGLTALHSLDLGYCGPYVRSHQYNALSSLTQLQHLSLRQAALTPQQHSALAGLTRLTRLHATSCSIGDAGILSSLVRLQDLDLSGASVGAAGIAALGTLTTLRTLLLRSNALGEGAGRLLRRLSRLEMLDVCGCRLSAACVRDISTLSTLRHLNLGVNAVTRDSAAELTALSRLKSLDLELSHLGIDGAEVLTLLTTLTSLGLADTGAGAQSLRALALLPKLALLDWTWNDLSAAGARALSGMRTLRHLCLDEGQLEPAVVEALSPITRSLQRLDVRYEVPVERRRRQHQLQHVVEEAVSVNFCGGSVDLAAVLAGALCAARAVPEAVVAHRRRRLRARFVIWAPVCLFEVAMLARRGLRVEDPLLRIALWHLLCGAHPFGSGRSVVVCLSHVKHCDDCLHTVGREVRRLCACRQRRQGSSRGGAAQRAATGWQLSLIWVATWVDAILARS